MMGFGRTEVFQIWMCSTLYNMYYRLARLQGQLERLQGTVVTRDDGLGLIHLCLDFQALAVLHVRVLCPIVDAVQTFQAAFHACEGVLVRLKLLLIALLGFLGPRLPVLVLVISLSLSIYILGWGSVALQVFET